jgi:hypothetical protein
MWECQACAYRNEDWDESCQRCGVERIARAAADDATVAAAPPAPVRSTAAPLSTPGASGAAIPPAMIATCASRARPPALTAPDSRRGGRLELALTGVIVLCIAALGALGYAAWQRGLLDPYIAKLTGRSTPGDASGAGGNAGTGAQAGPGAAEQLLSEQDILEDPLDRVAQARGWGVGKLKAYAKPLRDARGAIAGALFTEQRHGVLSSEAQAKLDELGALGDNLLKQYGKFEQDALKLRGKELDECKQLLRGEFQARFIELLDKLGEAYESDSTGRHAAYVLSDDIPRALEQYKTLDPAPVREHWQRVLHAREQMFLDLQNEDAYMQLQARYEALVEVHNQFNEALQAVPPYRLRGGTLDKSAATAITLYDSLATKVEDLVSEFEEYTAQLDPHTDSDKRKDAVKRFIELAQDDHYTAFFETYKIYAQDRELSDPAYEHLINVHYPFVEQHWPAKAPDYQAVSVQYEAEWKSHWHGQ